MTIDLRSDTVTLPSPAMRAAMSRAAVGDDVFGEDPTVNELEGLVASLTGKTAAVFVPSGTMGNLASLLAHAARGREVVLGDESHIYHYEAGGASALGGLVFHPVFTQPDGVMPLDAIDAALRAPAEWLAPPGVICIENTHNRCGGAIVPPEHAASVASLAERHGLPVHLDGARLFNAAVATGLPLTAWTDHASSVQVCLSKGLAAPVGSVVSGGREFVARVRRARKMLGGGMRQAGVLAAAGLLALTEMVDRLAEDHVNARLLAEGLARIDGVALDLTGVQTNIVVFRLDAEIDSAAFVHALRDEGVLIIDMGRGLLRAVTHYGVTADDCRTAIAACRRALQAARAGNEGR
jgi:threonine aldolase